jgi:rhodanese-related sulfurtransferase
VGVRPAVPEIDARDLSDPVSDHFVLDVREDDEWAAGHIDGASHIPMMQVPDHLVELPRQAKVLVVCRSGARSLQVTAFLTQQGWPAVNLAGGMQAWEAAGRSMVSENGEPPAVI